MVPKELLRVYTNSEDYNEVRNWCSMLGIYGWSMTAEFDQLWQRPLPTYVVIVYDNCKIGKTPEEVIQKVKSLSFLRWGK